MKIAMLLSGGVDSSVALRLLKEEGSHDITAFYLKIWLEDEMAFLGECPWEEDMQYVRAVCEQLDIPLQIVPLQREYMDRVVSYVLAELKQGRTPSPDILCNERIKFGAFFDAIDSSYDKVATGHYAQVRENEDGIFELLRAPDPVKDQTYFLSSLSQEQLSRACFPIGSLMKSRVRELAEEFDLPNKVRKDSQGICFLGKISYPDFVKFHLGEKQGEIIEIETGEKKGEHKGVWFHTIGQRSGLGLSGGPWYVVKKDLETNIVYISHKNGLEDQLRDEVTVNTVHWTSGKFPENTNLKVKLRHGPQMVEARIMDLGEDRAFIKLAEKDKGIAPGQSCIFYDEEICLGRGVIEQ